jgi:hypothetical protein
MKMNPPFCRRVLLALPLSCLVAVAVRAGDIPEPLEIPVVGRPANLPFSDAAGIFTVSARAEPTSVQVEQPLTFILSVHAEVDRCPRFLPPHRLDLAQIRAFDERFYILDDPKQDSYNEATHRWEFVYRLKPRRVDVTEIPGVPFVYFDPTIQPESKGFQTPYTDEIPLKVQTGDSVPLPVQQVPDLFLQTQPAAAVLDRRAAWSLPGWPYLILLLLAPPLVCAGWYMIWRRLYPDAARRLQQRRSRAATLALKLLQRLPRGATDERATHIAAAVTTYLQQRLDLPAAEPTPVEAARHLRAAGYPDALTKRAEEFFHTCDTARFYPNASAANLPESAQQLILDLEAHTWASAQS